MQRATATHGLAALVSWWRTATEAEKFEALKASIRGDTEAPPLKALHFAILASELKAAREGIGRGKTLHGQAAENAQTVTHGGRIQP